MFEFLFKESHQQYKVFEERSILNGLKKTKLAYIMRIPPQLQATRIIKYRFIFKTLQKHYQSFCPCCQAMCLAIRVKIYFFFKHFRILMYHPLIALVNKHLQQFSKQIIFQPLQASLKRCLYNYAWE